MKALLDSSFIGTTHVTYSQDLLLEKASPTYSPRSVHAHTCGPSLETSSDTSGWGWERSPEPAHHSAPVTCHSVGSPGVPSEEHCLLSALALGHCFSSLIPSHRQLAQQTRKGNAGNISDMARQTQPCHGECHRRGQENEKWQSFNNPEDSRNQVKPKVAFQWTLSQTLY